MQKLLQQITNYIYLGHSPSLISFADDGLPEIYDMLSVAMKTPQSYDPPVQLCTISFQYITDRSVVGIETEIANNLALNPKPYKTIIDAIKDGYDIIVVADDIDVVEDYAETVLAVDGIVKKYRNKVRFVYIIEDSAMLDKLKSGVYSHSTILDAAIYHRIGEDWSLEMLNKICKEQYRQELPAEKLTEIGNASGMHYGIFKRLYRDAILGTNHTQVYIDSLLDNFNIAEINMLKKFVSEKSLNDQEQKIKRGFELVGLIKDENLTVPVLMESITHYRIKGKIEVDEQNDKIKGLDLDLLTKGERAIIEQMMTAGGEISKDEIGDLIWGDKVNEYYSEWAIDQRMSRLKRKLADLGFNIDIKTIYGKGYQLVKLK